MKLTRIAQLGAVAAVAALTLTACAANEDGGGAATETGESLSGTLNATGASSQDAAQQAWIAAFQTANPNATVNYQATGSGVGRDNFLAGGQSFIGSDRAFEVEEIAAGGFGSCASDAIVEVPVYISPVAIIFNLDGVDTLNLKPDVIAQIFDGKITQWNDPAIAADNPDTTLPDTKISPVHRSDPSGTSETFATYLSAVTPDAWPYEVSDEWPISSGESAQGTSGVVAAVTSGAGTIGYADASQAGDLGTAAVEVDGEYIAYSSEAAAQLVDSSPLAEGRGAGDLVFEVDPSAATDGAYPIALVSYLIACEKYDDAAIAELVKAYFSYVVSAEGQDVAADAAGSAPISDTLREKINAAIELIG
ncbi:MAG: phosphate ABC transporter substrate-binding protein PstS [Microbacterium sp.]|uniref:phosphate ABC transporter substrate-binding protein PstS n=1 Tax=Microbacterium sp. TaxID=51671 RepID=UPI0039E4484F